MNETASATGVRWRRIGFLVFVVLLLVGANLLARDFVELLDIRIRPRNEDAVHRMIMITAGLYTLLLAVPFVPGAEIGLALIGVLGPRIALLVYLCTVAGLSLSFVVGRLVPFKLLVRLAGDFRLTRTHDLLEKMEPLDAHERLDMLTSNAPRRLLPFFLRHRYLALAVALNVPGNYIIGGGGGIALFAGLSRLFSVGGFLLTILLAVAPIPLAIMIFGAEFVKG